MHKECLGVPLRVGQNCVRNLRTLVLDCAASPRSEQSIFANKPNASLRAFRFYPSREAMSYWSTIY
jgi:hypothetical protein